MSATVVLGKDEQKKLERFAKLDRKKTEELAVVAIDQYLKWREDDKQSFSKSHQLPTDVAEKSIVVLINPEQHDKLRKYAFKDITTIGKILQHAVSRYLEKRSSARNACPHCESKNLEVRNHSFMWHDGDIYCEDCGTYVRDFDAG